MATQSLYNRWRAQTFAELLGQEHITHTLRNQIRAGRIGHAYLFTGLRGTGKTSTARILAKAVNCIGDTTEPPCNQCHLCKSITDSTSLDLVEIDAASNRGIDEIRDLRDRIHFAPHECRYKVYVIDEVHMLTNEAFNALLKTLEEPPAHVIFVLCTTEPHRLPDTILSRCQRYDFRRVAVSTLMQKLERICAEERIAIEPEALEFVARRATGSFRDAESLLDQLAVYGSDQITLALVQNALGSVPWILVSDLVTSIFAGDIPTGLRCIREAIDQGAEPRQLVGDILDHLRALLLIGVGGNDDLDTLGEDSVAAMRRLASRAGFDVANVVQAIKLFNEAGQGLRNASRLELPLELALVESVLSSGRLGSSQRPSAEPESTTRESTAPPGPAPSAQAPAGRAVEPAVETPAVPTTSGPPPPSSSRSAGLDGPDLPSIDAGASRAPTSARPVAADDASGSAGTEAGHVQESAPEVAPTEKLTVDWVRQHWSLVLLKVNPRSKQVRALLSSAFPVAVSRQDAHTAVITLGCEADFHRDMLTDDKRLALIEEVFSEVLGMVCHVQCAVHEDVQAAKQHDAVPPDAPAQLFAQEKTVADLESELLNHPVVKELQKRGGQVTDIRVHGRDAGGR